MISALIGGVLPHQRPLLVRQGARLEQHPVGDGDLADVVQIRGLLEQLDPPRRPAQLPREHDRVRRDPRRVPDRVDVLGGERRAQGAQVAEVQALDVLEELGVVHRHGGLLGEPARELELGLRETALRSRLDERQHAQWRGAVPQRDGEAGLLAVAFHGLPDVRGEVRVGDRLHDDVVALQQQPVRGVVRERIRLVHVLVRRSGFSWNTERMVMVSASASYSKMSASGTVE